MYWLTDSVEQSPWKANRFSARQEITCILYNPKVHCRIHKHPPPVPVLSHIYLVHALTSHFQKVRINITFPFTPGSSKWSLSLKYPHQNPGFAETVLWLLIVLTQTGWHTLRFRSLRCMCKFGKADWLLMWFFRTFFYRLYCFSCLRWPFDDSGTSSVSCSYFCL
jgi:hypothetical protein